jgi:serine/threonine-protein kinase HipA
LLDRDEVLPFAYARSYVERPDSISLFPPELPLRRGAIDPTSPAADTGWPGYVPAAGRSPLPLAGCLRDAAPDAWGRRVLNRRLAADPEADLDELTYLLASGSDRIGALDFQESAQEYVPRDNERATLEHLVAAAELIESQAPIPEELAAAAWHGTSVGGARPKALLDDGARRLIAKFSSSTDSRPVVKAEAVGMVLARQVGIDVAPVEMVRAMGRDVLLVERFDRPETGGRRLIVSALTILGLRDTESRYGSYAELAAAMRYPGWDAPRRSQRELFRRLVLNVCIGNSDDHLRNHAAFWDGESLQLTPAYDLAPQRRSTTTSSQAIGITRDGRSAAQLRLCRTAAPEFGLSSSQAQELIDHVVSTIRSTWNDACDEATLTASERSMLWGREILNDYIFWDDA